ncbi:MAG TPA: DUF397 domain-containing protein [Streptosporangiaceae bacterium]
MRAEYNGMSASSLDGAQWQASHGAPVHEGGVELAMLPGGTIAMRSSQDPGGPALIYTYDEIEAFINGTKDGEFDHLVA